MIPITQNRLHAGPISGVIKYFSTLYLASGYWQVRISREKTAFVGLFKFCVISFGLMNAPGVFQHLMQQVIGVLHPLKGPNFVIAYIDGLLVYSKTLEEHLQFTFILYYLTGKAVR